MAGCGGGGDLVLRGSACTTSNGGGGPDGASMLRDPTVDLPAWPVDERPP